MVNPHIFNFNAIFRLGSKWQRNSYSRKNSKAKQQSLGVETVKSPLKRRTLRVIVKQLKIKLLVAGQETLESMFKRSHDSSETSLETDIGPQPPTKMILWMVWRYLRMDLI